jgi:hypothetical protein
MQPATRALPSGGCLATCILQAMPPGRKLDLTLKGRIQCLYPPASTFCLPIARPERSSEGQAAESLMQEPLTHRSSPPSGSGGRRRPRAVVRIECPPRHSFARWLVALATCLLSAALAHAQLVDQSLWGVDPAVTITAAAISGNTLYVGGSFSSVGPVIGSGAITDAADGALRPNNPSVAGAVYACIPDGGGGWFIGGDFTAVGGYPRANVAHIFASGRVDVMPGPDGQVRSRIGRCSDHRRRVSAVSG